MNRPKTTPRKATLLRAIPFWLVVSCVTLSASLGCSLLGSSCPAPVQGPPKVECPLPPEPTPPVLSPGSADGSVTLTPADAVALGEYVRALRHRDEIATACLGTPAKAWDGPTVALDGSGKVGTNLGLVEPALALEAKILDPGLVVLAADCGEANAFYLEDADVVILCRELDTYAVTSGHPLAMRAVLAHEIGHALIHELGLPFTGSEEFAADEYADVILPVLAAATDDRNYAEAVLDTALMFLHRDQPENPMDDHPGDERRAYTAACFYYGAVLPADHQGCASRYKAALTRWGLLLSTFGAP